MSGDSGGGGGYTVDYGTWGGDASGEAIPIQGSSGNIDAGTWDNASGASGVDWQKVLKAAQQLGGDGSGQGKDVANIPGAALPGLRPNTGVPAHAGALTALLQMLNQRRDMYLQAATNPQAGAVRQPPPGPGLLGV